MYKLDYSVFTKEWLVVNTCNGIAQSAWTHKADAMGVLKDLNKMYIAGKISLK